VNLQLLATPMLQNLVTEAGLAYRAQYRLWRLQPMFLPESRKEGQYGYSHSAVFSLFCGSPYHHFAVSEEVRQEHQSPRSQVLHQEPSDGSL
jgi:hypothetical protein